MNPWSFLLLSILSSCSINLIFKGFHLFDINRFAAIVVNYLVCFITGLLLSGPIPFASASEASGFYWVLALGGFFVLIFYFMALTTHHLGVSVNAVSSKMAMVIPIFLAFVVFKEEVKPLFIPGLLAALTSIYLISSKKGMHLDRKHFIYPVLVFAGSGIIDFSLKWFQSQMDGQLSMSHLSMTIFLAAFSVGLLVTLIRRFTGHYDWSYKNILAGIVLGVPNYFSIFFLLKALEGFDTESALVFSLNNLSIVLLSSLLSVLLFKEHLNRSNRWGLGLAIIAILLISYGG